MRRPLVQRATRSHPAAGATLAVAAVTLAVAGPVWAQGSGDAGAAPVAAPPTGTSPAPWQSEVGPDGQPLSPADKLVLRLQQPLPPGQAVPGVTPRQDRGGFVAKVLENSPAVDAPGGSRVIWTAKPTTVHTGNATRLMIVKARFDASGRPWLGVQLPIRPNERLGWIRADAARVEFTNVFIRVRLNARTISVYRDGRLWSRSGIVIGAPKTPTPRGLFAIYEAANQGNSTNFLGPWALHLTAFSTVLENYGGGPGRAAIHGRGPESIEDAKLGEAASHGCVRTPNAFVSWLQLRTKPGTPVQIAYR